MTNRTPLPADQIRPGTVAFSTHKVGVEGPGLVRIKAVNEPFAPLVRVETVDGTPMGCFSPECLFVPETDDAPVIRSW